MKNHIKAPALAVAAVFALSGCNLLDVDNPNNLVEESVKLESAANGMANGSLRLVSDAIGGVWEAPGVVADEFYWTGSRDAWGQLDNGFVADPLNEFTDGRFPSLGRAVWMAQEAVNVLSVHVENNPGNNSFAKDLARAQMFNGLIRMVTGEIQNDMTFSNKMEDGPPVGPANMSGVLDDAITNLTAAVDGFTALGEDELVTRARAIRARAHMSRAIWDEINPSADGLGGALNFGSAVTDANAVLAAVDRDWQYALVFSSASDDSAMLGNVNERGENQIDDSLIENDGPGASGRTGKVVLQDPVTSQPDSAVIAKWVGQFGDSDFGEITIVSARLLRLIIAEHELANTNVAAFEEQIDSVRALNSKPAFNSGGLGMPTDLAILQHERRVNTLFMGLRLQDMYRWGITDPRWQPASQAVLNPGVMLPITIVECRANSFLDSACNPVTPAGG